jgi:DNA repair exonuclease SbcCD nuclease subunit
MFLVKEKEGAMKILHTSDIHIDSPLTSRLPADKVRQRRRELLGNLKRLVDEARSNSAKAIIIAGDLFDSEKISRKAIDTAFDIIESASDITFFYLQGNHEGDAFIKGEKTLPDNLKTFDSDWTYYRLGDVTIAGRSEIREGMFESLSLPKDSKNLLILHGEIRDKSAFPESIGIKEAVGRNIDYIALGHYHSYSAEAIDDRGVAIYSGTPEGRGFDESGDKGYVMIDTDGRGVRYSFKSFASRKLHIVSIDLSGIVRTAEINERTRKAVQGISYSDIVRVELTGRYFPTLWKDIDSILRDFESKFYYFEVKDSSRIAINPEDYRLDKSLKGEFIRTVSADKTIDEETKEKIIACGINALMGEELFD